MADTRRKWLKWALVASVALNLAFAGLVVGAIIKGPPRTPWPGIALLQYARALPEPFREDLGRSLRDQSGDWKRPREALRAQREALAEALTTEPFRPEAVADLLARETQLTADLSTRGAALLVAQIDRMTPDQRGAYATALLEPPRGGPRKHRGD